MSASALTRPLTSTEGKGPSYPVAVPATNSLAQSKKGVGDLVTTGMKATVKNAAEDVLSARIEDLAGAGVAQRDSTVLRVGTALGANHQTTAVEKVVPRGMHASAREGARSLTHMEAPNASEGCRGAAHLDGDVPQARENLQRDLGGGRLGDDGRNIIRSSPRLLQDTPVKFCNFTDHHLHVLDISLKVPIARVLGQAQLGGRVSKGVAMAQEGGVALKNHGFGGVGSHLYGGNGIPPFVLVSQDLPPKVSIGHRGAHHGGQAKGETVRNRGAVREELSTRSV